jgi:hypothetical protein
MAPKPLTYRTRDLVQALHSARLAGLSIRRLEIDKEGKITVEMGQPVIDTGDMGDMECDQRLEELEKAAASEIEKAAARG